MWARGGAALETSLRTVIVVLVGDQDGGGGGGLGRPRGTGASAVGLTPRHTLEVPYLDAQATPWTNSVRISGGGIQASVFLKTLRGSQCAATIEKTRRWRAGLLKL